MNEIIYSEIQTENRNEIRKFIKSHWGSEKIVTHSIVYYPADLNGYFAKHHNKIVGLVTFTTSEEKIELISLNSEIENKGIATQLIKLVEEYAVKNCIKKLALFTTNDNLNAIKFYQKRGFTHTETFYNAVDECRKIKPEIPKLAENGIEIKDELRFEKFIKG